MIAALAVSAGVSLTAGAMIDAGGQNTVTGTSAWEGIGVEGGLQLRFQKPMMLAVTVGFVPALYGEDIDFVKRSTRADLSILLSTMVRFGADSDVEHRAGIGLLGTRSWDLSGRTGPYYYYEPGPMSRLGPAAGYELSSRVADRLRVAAALWLGWNPFGRGKEQALPWFFSASLRIKIEVPV